MVFSKVWQVAMDRTMYKIINYSVVTWYGIIGRRGLPNPGRCSTRVHIIVPAVPYRAGTVESTVPAGTVRHGTARVRIGKIYSRAVPCWHGKKTASVNVVLVLLS